MSIDISDIRTVYAGTIGLDGESADAARMSAIEGNLTTLLARPSITELADIPDVDDSGKAAGKALLVNSSADGYELGDPSGAIALVDSITDVSTLTTGAGLTSSEPNPGEAELAVAFAGTGSAGTASRSDHTHTIAGAGFVTYEAKGSLSSGSMTLATFTFPLTNGVEYLIIGTLHATQRANGESSNYYQLGVNIDGGNRVSQQMQCVGFVPNSRTHSAAVVRTGTGANITMTASIIYNSGVPVLVDAGDLMVQLFPRR